MAYGTLSSLDTLASSQQSVIAYGEDKAFAEIKAALDAHNAIVRDEISKLADISTDARRRYGTAASMTMSEVDEGGRGDAQKIAAGTTVDFPLRLRDITIQWTRKFMENTTAVELAAQFSAAMDAHLLMIQRDLRRALFTPTNYTFVDRLIDSTSLAVKALINADGASLPLGPNGEEFDGSTHTHYLARVGALAATDVTGVIETLLEHYSQGGVVLLINRAQEAAIRAFTNNFTAYLDARIMPGANTTTASGTLSQNNLYNRAIGIFDSAEVWVKPWIPAGYMVAYLDGGLKPLVMRERRAGASGLTIAAEDEKYPLRARTMEAEYGFGVWNRTAAAILYTGGTSYSTPTF